jgi:hypothetical protein
VHNHTTNIISTTSPIPAATNSTLRRMKALIIMSTSSASVCIKAVRQVEAKTRPSKSPRPLTPVGSSFKVGRDLGYRVTLQPRLPTSPRRRYWAKDPEVDHSALLSTQGCCKRSTLFRGRLRLHIWNTGDDTLLNYIGSSITGSILLNDYED